MSTRCEAPGCRKRRRDGTQFCLFHAASPSAVNESQLRSGDRSTGRDLRKERRERRIRVERRRTEDRARADMDMVGEAVRGILEDLALPEAHIEILVKIARDRIYDARVDAARKALTRADLD